MSLSTDTAAAETCGWPAVRVLLRHTADAALCHQLSPAAPSSHTSTSTSALLLALPLGPAHASLDLITPQSDHSPHSSLTPLLQLITIMYLKVSISDFLTLFSSRTVGPFWESRPGNFLLAGAGTALSISTILASAWPAGNIDRMDVSSAPASCVQLPCAEAPVPCAWPPDPASSLQPAQLLRLQADLHPSQLLTYLPPPCPAG
jgi:hypothetical protein